MIWMKVYKTVPARKTNDFHNKEKKNVCYVITFTLIIIICFQINFLANVIVATEKFNLCNRHSNFSQQVFSQHFQTTLQK
jgi:hypothetical protein